MNAKNILIFAVFLAVFFLAILPYLKHVVQKQSLDTDLGSILLDYNTMGKVRFAERVGEICRKAGLPPESYHLVIQEDPVSRRVTVELQYDADFSIFFFKRVERVVLRNTTSNLDL